MVLPRIQICCGLLLLALVCVVRSAESQTSPDETGAGAGAARDIRSLAGELRGSDQLKAASEQLRALIPKGGSGKSDEAAAGETEGPEALPPAEVQAWRSKFTRMATLRDQQSLAEYAGEVMAQYREWLGRLRRRSLPRQIVRHIRGSDAGSLPLPTSETIVMRRRELMADSLGARRLPPLKYKLKAEAPLQRCSENRTIKYLNAATAEGGKLLEDRIYLYREQLPLNPDLTFGSRAKVYVYENQDQQGAFRSARSYGMTCLPYRMRLTSAGRYDYMGQDALRKYDENGDGTGN